MHRGRSSNTGASSQSRSNYALADHQMQLMLLERQNKKRLLEARSSNTPFEFEEDDNVERERAIPALGYPRQIGDEEHSITAGQTNTDTTSEFPQSITSNATLSPDQKYLAVACGSEILVYDVNTRALQERIISCQRMPDLVQFAPRSPENLRLARGATYLLISQRNGPTEHALLWYLNPEGKIKRHCEQLDQVRLASIALGSIEHPLRDRGWSADDIAGSSLAKDFQAAILNEEKRQVAKVATQLSGVLCPGKPFRADGRYLIYQKNMKGSYPLRPLTQLVVHDIDTNEDICHIDNGSENITSVHCHPDGRWLASVTMTGQLRIHSIRDGIQTFITESTHGFVKSVAFSPDFQYAIIETKGRSTQSESKLGVFIVSEGAIDWTTGQSLGLQRTTDVVWNPNSTHIAISQNLSVDIWSVMFASPEITKRYILKPSSEGYSHGSNIGVSWLDEGRKILLDRAMDGEMEIRDRYSNTKWRIHKHKRTYSGRNAWVLKDQMLLTSGNDGKIRYWKL